MKTFIKWQGNKSKHIKKFEKYIPDYVYNDDWKGTYIEPFVGSGALLLNIEPEKWIINDLNKDLINVWKQVKDNPKKIINFFKSFGTKFKKLSKENKMKMGKTELKKMEKMDYTLKRAQLYMVLKEVSYMGNIIVNNKFYFPNLDLNITVNNVYTCLSEGKFKSILDASEFFNNTKGIICNKDYKKILEKAKKGDFVFLDPPYLEKHNYGFNYNKDEIIDEKFVNDLLKELKKLDKKGVQWMMTQSYTSFIKKVFKDYTIKKFKAYRIAKKGYSDEAIIMNY